MTVAQLEATMEVDEFREWIIYTQIAADRQREAMKNGSNRQTPHPHHRQGPIK